MKRKFDANKVLRGPGFWILLLVIAVLGVLAALFSPNISSHPPLNR